jgi:membrane protein implicated in regulation of membrane protease activity
MRFVFLFLAIVFAVAGVSWLVSIPRDRDQVQSSVNEFAGQRRQVLDKYRQQTGKEPKENLAWIPGVLDKVPGWVAPFNMVAATGCFALSAVLFWAGWRGKQSKVKGSNGSKAGK